MIIGTYAIKILVFLLVGYYVYKIFRKAEAKGTILEKQENLKLNRELYRVVESDISDENIQSIKRDKKGLKKFNSL